MMNQEPSMLEIRHAIGKRMKQVKHKILVMSGKGGVGKSTVAVNMATALIMEGKRVGLLDIDIHGPSIPTMLGVGAEKLQERDGCLLPLQKGELKVMSIGFLLGNQDDPVIWRGPMKMSMIQQFLKDVDWGELDYLIVDCPPGTGDEPLSICQLLDSPDGAVIVTTPQEVAAADVRKSVNFCLQLQLNVIGVIENMSGFSCPKCGEVVHIFNTGGGEQLAQKLEVPFLGSLPLDPAIGQACDTGKPFVYFNSKTETAKQYRELIKPILD
jgi:Mrp family chromosome partitioning ATPase